MTGAQARFVAANLCFGLCVIAAACGDDSNDVARTDTAPDRTGSARPNIVTGEDLEATTKGSVERAVLGFFQAVQFGDEEGAADSVAPDELRSVGSRRFARDVRSLGATLGRPTIANVTENGQTARARTEIVSYSAGNEKPVLSDPTTLRLERDSGRWRLSDLSYFTRTAALLRRKR